MIFDYKTTSMNFNTSPNIFRAAAPSYLARKIRLLLKDGHIFAGPDGCVARFANDSDALRCLNDAGYKGVGGFFEPPVNKP